MSSMGQTEREAASAAAAASLQDSLEQVRDILFGPQYRELARRLARTDAHLADQAEELRSDLRRRFDLLESHARHEYEALTTAIESQRAAQAESVATLTREVRDSLSLLEQRLRKLEELVARTQRDFRQQMLDQSKSFIDEVRRTHEAFSAAVERVVSAEPREAALRGGSTTEEEEGGRAEQGRHSEAA